QDDNNELQHCHTTSWGMSTRMIGAVILGHGDDQGLVLPPRLAPVQLVIIAIGRGEDGARAIDKAHDLAAKLQAVGVRVQVDDRDESPGFKLNDWELKGVPLRAELGPRDLEGGHVLLSRRIGETDDRGRPVKEKVGFDDLVGMVPDALDAYHDTLVDRARSFRDDNTDAVDDWDAFVERVEFGFAEALHCGRELCEDEIKAETTATPRAILIDQDDDAGPCVRCGEDSAYGKRVVFAKAY
ncbi:MAG: His/Gly/Thr/Pro-type tRNA ligase C-terminal domain-containing protein, partial [Nitriliruptorales bacterium]|nr:His/Gly/Thr/Pro-type tRNA ligase C-terminal domain-containing protein [Nitriliruptorales bacterium]